MLDKESLLKFLKDHADDAQKNNNLEYELAMRRTKESIRLGEFDTKQEKCRWEMIEEFLNPHHSYTYSACNKNETYLVNPIDSEGYIYCPYCGKEIEEVNHE